MEEKRRRATGKTSLITKTDGSRIWGDSQGKWAHATRKILLKTSRKVKWQRNGQLDSQKGKNDRRDREIAKGKKAS